MLISRTLLYKICRLNNPVRGARQGQSGVCFAYAVRIACVLHPSLHRTDSPPSAPKRQSPRKRNFPAPATFPVDAARAPRYIAPQCPDGGIGRRTGFRYQRCKAWRFESSSGHQYKKKSRANLRGCAAFSFVFTRFYAHERAQSAALTKNETFGGADRVQN